MLNRKPKAKEGETWKEVEGEENYWISNLGRFAHGDKLMKIAVASTGYATCNIGHTRVKVHRLVAKAFVDNPDPENFDIVDHIDGNKLNNNATNLRWVDAKENVQAAYRNNQINNKGRYMCLVSDKEENVTLYKNQTLAAQDLGIKTKSVSEASRGQRKKVGDYRFMRVKEFIDKRDWNGN